MRVVQIQDSRRDFQGRPPRHCLVSAATRSELTSWRWQRISASKAKVGGWAVQHLSKGPPARATRQCSASVTVTRQQQHGGKAGRLPGSLRLPNLSALRCPSKAAPRVPLQDIFEQTKSNLEGLDYRIERKGGFEAKARACSSLHCGGLPAWLGRGAGWQLAAGHALGWHAAG